MKQQKIALAIFSLIAIFSLAVSPALADKGINIITDVNGTENFFYARPTETMELGTSYVLFQDIAFNDMFRVDRTGTIYGHQLCDETGANCHDISTGWDSLGGSSWTVSGSNIYNSNSGNVGIGTTVPAASLDVRSSGDDALRVYSGINVVRIGTDANLPNFIRFRPITGDGIAFTGDNDDVGLFIDSGTGANVGVGTTNPGSALQVIGGVTVGSPGVGNASANDLHVADEVRIGGATGYLYLAGGATINAAGSAQLKLQTDGGNVGIGTASPGYKLEIQGGATATGGVMIQNGGIHPDLTLIGNQGNIYAQFTEQGVNDDGRLDLNESGSVKVRLRAAGGSFFNGGNVGIGTTNPVYPLDIYSGANDVVRVRGADHAIVAIDGTDSSEKALNFTEGGSLRWKIGMDNGPAGTTDDFVIKQTNNAAADFTIKTSGNIGIGTGSPSKTLHVNDGALVGDTYQVPQGSIFTSASQAQMILGGSFNAGYNSGSNKAKLLITSYDNDDATDIFPIYVEDENGYTDFYLRNRQTASAKPTAWFGGNIGVNNDLPEAPLHIVNNADDWGIIIDNGHLTIRDVLEGTINTSLNDDGGSSYINAIGGNVGIGTTNPNATLDVNGGVWLGGSGGKLATFGERASDNGAYEYVEFQSGSSRAGIMLWDGDWSGCDSGKFCIFGDTHQLMLKSNAGDVVVDDNLDISGVLSVDGVSFFYSGFNAYGPYFDIYTKAYVSDDLSVGGRISTNEGVQVGAGDVCSASREGQISYYSNSGESYIAVCMRFSDTGYSDFILQYNGW